MKGRNIDISSEPASDSSPEAAAAADEVASSDAGLNTRPFLGVRFDCCDMYVRIYMNKQGTSYNGRCPRCGKAVCFQVGDGGTSSRFFSVS